MWDLNPPEYLPWQSTTTPSSPIGQYFRDLRGSNPSESPAWQAGVHTLQTQVPNWSKRMKRNLLQINSLLIILFYQLLRSLWDSNPRYFRMAVFKTAGIIHLAQSSKSYFPMDRRSWDTNPGPLIIVDNLFLISYRGSGIWTLDLLLIRETLLTNWANPLSKSVPIYVKELWRM